MPAANLRRQIKRLKESGMHFGGAMFFTDYSMSAAELARALEERGFESVWAPEHSHIPLSRKTPFPGGGDLPKPYYDAMDPFVVLAAAAQVTRTIKLGTGVALIQQRDAIPDRQAGRLDRSGEPGTVPVRSRGWLGTRTKWKTTALYMPPASSGCGNRSRR
jgi:hypothetical protein